MFYVIDNCRISPIDNEKSDLRDGRQYLAILSYDQSKTLADLGVDADLAKDAEYSPSMVFENHEGFDFISVNMLSHKALFSHPDKVCIYVLQNVLLFVCNHCAIIEKMLKDPKNENSCVGFERLLSTFFERLTSEDVIFLEKIEKEISGLENALISSGKKNCVKEIVSLRKRLMVFKQYYEQMLNILDELSENENSLLRDNTLRYFRIYAGKVERLYHNVLNLRDYVTQVREAYQAEVDIALNNIMKIFTVITAIFLPLTLLVGWYGMNIRMPEFEWAYSYPMVIVLSIAVVILCLFYFKKKKWF